MEYNQRTKSDVQLKTAEYIRTSNGIMSLSLWWWEHVCRWLCNDIEQREQHSISSDNSFPCCRCVSIKTITDSHWEEREDGSKIQLRRLTYFWKSLAQRKKMNEELFLWWKIYSLSKYFSFSTLSLPSCSPRSSRRKWLLPSEIPKTTQ